MNLEFTEIEFDDDLTDLDEDELVDLVREYQEAQKKNRDSFEDAEDTLNEFAEYDDSLTERVEEETSLPSGEAERLSFSGKRSLLADLDDETESESGDGEFDEMGNKGKTQTGNNETETTKEFVTNAVPDRFQLDE
jgi:hypothetical protein